MIVVIRHVLLAVSLLALGGFSIRLAATLTPSGLERVVAAASIGAAVAVVEALALGLPGLGGSSAALTSAAVLTWVAGRVLIPRSEKMSPNLAAKWVERSRAEQACLAAVAGVFVAFSGLMLWRPQPGWDGLTYHISDVVSFVQSGHPGEVVQLNYSFPLGSYPITDEVLMAWATGISHGFAALTLWTPVSALLLIVAGWLGLRELGVHRPVAALALAALLAGPLVTASLTEVRTDLPALTWLVCCAALCLGARRRPLLLAPGIVAFGLAVGTKTTTVVLGALVLGWALWTSRARLRGLMRPLGLAVILAGVAGGTWFVRNLLVHGSPLWPFEAAPWGDPVPRLVRLVTPTLFDRLQTTLLDDPGVWVAGFSGSLILLAGAVLSPIFVFRRRVVLAAGVTLVGTLVWANSPVTGAGAIPGLAALAKTPIWAGRYLMPEFACGALALALAATDGGLLGRSAALAALGGAVVWGLITDHHQHLVAVSHVWVLVCAIGALVAVVMSELWRYVSRGLGAAVQAIGSSRRRETRLLAVAASTVAAGILLAVGSDGFLSRHALVTTELDASVARVLAAEPHYEISNRPVLMDYELIGPLAGDTLSHPIALLPRHGSCSTIVDDAERDWVVIQLAARPRIPGHPGIVYPPPGSGLSCLRRARAGIQTPRFLLYPPARPAPASAGPPSRRAASEIATTAEAISAIG